MPPRDGELADAENLSVFAIYYTYTKDEAKLRLRDKIVVYGAVPRANIRPPDLGPVIVPEYDGFACREMRWGCAWVCRDTSCADTARQSRSATYRGRSQS